MMMNPNNECHCGSEMLLKQCCLPDESPITDKNQGFTSIIMNSQLFDEWDNPIYPLFGMKTTVKMRKLHQLSSQIDSLTYSAVQRGGNIEGFQVNVENSLKSLNDSLHAAHYHKIQFLYRFRLLEVEDALNYIRIDGNVVIELDDMPLRYEFESYISTVRTSLDVLAKVVGIHLKKNNIETNGGLFSYLKKQEKNVKVSNLRYLYFKNEPWIAELKAKRDAIQHSGFIPGFKSFEYDKGLTSPPTSDNLIANHVCFRIWKDLIGFINDVLLELFPEKMIEKYED